ncbi:amino acid ABC transporter permease [Aerococcus sp. JJEM-2022c]|uniref:amino acid ABC transporter permease n=1 Tax=Aerococcus sp. Group 2 TaxID=2976811 RepID=UPI00227A2FC9|nr:amino acid ABC transporter permease [Aerococcus sp. Group 2]MCY3040418.1 amino acid ABC transporter permease [Aerococcus sp. Group 2]
MVSFDFNLIFPLFKDLLAFIPVTLLVLVLSFVIGNLLGFFLAYGLKAEQAWYHGLAKSYIFIMRCTPPIVMIFLIFYGLPQLLEWWLRISIHDWSQAIYVIIALSLLYAANISVVFKASYDAVDDGLREAGLALGLSAPKTFFLITFPEALRIALPNIGNSTVSLLKNTALAYTIGLIDVMGAGQLFINRQMGNYSLETYLAVAIIYWLIAAVVMVIIHLTEKRISKGEG